MARDADTIVSKRSVERLFYAHEPPFYRYFVHKPQARSALVNRIYYLRLKAIEALVLDFFLRDSSKLNKVVVNLGCGNDVLPWSFSARHPSICRGALFIDVDTPDQMAAKRQVVLENPALSSLVGEGHTASLPHIILQSPNYCQIGCDAGDVQCLQTALSTIADLSNSDFLFITDFPTPALSTTVVDGLIQLSSSMKNASFILLDELQLHLPDDLPAEETTESCGLPANDIVQSRRQQMLQLQQGRFETRGWPSVHCATLWEVWGCDSFITPAERTQTSQLDPFDSWEELAAHTSRFLVLTAMSDSTGSRPPLLSGLSTIPVSAYEDVFVHDVLHHSKKTGRRFGAAFVQHTPVGDEFASHLHGETANGQPSSCTIFNLNDEMADSSRIPLIGPGARIHFTLTDLGGLGTLMIGGCSAALQPVPDCWLFSSLHQKWERVQDLPRPVFRHSAVRLGSSHLALVVGGKTDSGTASSEAWVMNPSSGWLLCEVLGDVRLPPLSGAVVASYCPEETLPRGQYAGIVAGGMKDDCTINNDVYVWNLDITQPKGPRIKYNRAAGSFDRISRFGAQCVQHGRWSVVIGGVLGRGYESPCEDALVLRVTKTGCKVALTLRLRRQDLRQDEESPLPGIGVSALSYMDFILLFGGSTLSPSGELTWKKDAGVFHLSREKPLHQPLVICNLILSMQRNHTAVIVSPAARQPSETGPRPSNDMQEIPRVQVSSKDSFEQLVHRGLPAIITNLEIGKCKSEWSLDYLAAKIGDEEVIVHESVGEKMDFNAKDFTYTRLAFRDMAERIKGGSCLYMRALSRSAPSKAPASLESDFPAVAGDFQLGHELDSVRENHFSSVLRISGPVNMWLHYDVMANVYCQVVGSKRMILFPPADVTRLGFEAGASSSSLDVFSALGPNSSSLGDTSPNEAILGPGEVLYLPPLWPHTAKPISDTSIAVNVFFKNLKRGYSSGRDVYGNRDLEAYEKARRDVAGIVRSFKPLPSDIRTFYLQRLSDELMTTR